MAELIAKNLCLDYPIFGTSSRSLKKTFLKITTGGTLSTDSSTVVVRAVKNITFHLQHGDRLALVGHNGAGKSTLLRVLAGIYTPTSGELAVSGSVGSLLDISLGMQAEATGYENIYIRGLILGLKKPEIEAIIPSIEEFTDMGDFLHMPVKTYSAGMRVRLAFAISTAINTEILLIDESIGAGDASFKDKAKKRIVDFIDRAHIMVLASHDDDFVKEFCNKALWLEHGEAKSYGDTKTVLEEYQASVAAEKP
ncbi:MAG: ABC transporter ATP-binding protein [Gammaproteobacteria bacterium]|nr:ABC transporter ATP-binding protein [Gammaproteobacteria bacterium]